MSTTAPNLTTVEAQRQLFEALQPFQKDVTIMQRIQAHVVLKTGKKLTEFLNNGATEEDKLAMINELIEIATEKAWDKLPAAAVGQAQAPAIAKPRVTTPLIKKAEEKKTLPDGTDLNTALAAAHAVDAAAAKPKATDLLAAAIAAMEAEAKAKPAAEPAISEEQIKKIVRTELADVLEKVAAVLRQ